MLIMLECQVFVSSSTLKLLVISNYLVIVRVSKEFGAQIFSVEVFDLCIKMGTSDSQK